MAATFAARWRRPPSALRVSRMARRHRRFGRQALRVTDEVPVQHHVADHDDAPALHPVQQLNQPVAQDRGGCGVGLIGSPSRE
jgi:hypothetical protein